MRLERVQPGDVVRCAIKGRTGIWGEVTEIKDGIVHFRGLCLRPGGGTRAHARSSATGEKLDAAAATTTRLRFRASSCRCPGCTREPRDVDTRHVAGASIGGRQRRVAAQLV
jgi:hypothetical protein